MLPRKFVNEAVLVALGVLGRELGVAALLDEALRGRAIEGIAGQRQRAPEVRQAVRQALRLATVELRERGCAEGASHRTAEEQVLRGLVAQTVVGLEAAVVAVAKFFEPRRDAEVGGLEEAVGVGLDERDARLGGDGLDGAAGLGGVGESHLANDVVERRGDGVVGDVEFLAAVLGVEREADGTGRALPNFTGEFRVNEVECGIAGLLLLDADAVEHSGGVAVGGTAKNIQRIRGGFGKGSAEPALGDGVGGEVHDFVEAVGVANLPVESVEDGAFRAEERGVAVVGDVGLARADIDRAEIKRDIDAEGIPVVCLRHDDVVVTRRGDRRRRKFDVGLVVLVRGLAEELDVLGEVVAVGEVEAGALDLGREPDEFLEIIEVRRVALGHENLGYIGPRDGGVELAARAGDGRVRERGRRGGERAEQIAGASGRNAAGAREPGDDRAEGHAGDIHAVLAVDLAGGGTGQANAGLRTRSGAQVEEARGDEWGVLRPLFFEETRGEIGVGTERSVDTLKRAAREVGEGGGDAPLAGASADEHGEVFLPDIGVRRVTVGAVDFDSVKILAVNDVYDTRRGVSPVNGGGPVLQHLDALDHGERKAVEIDEHRAAGGVGGGDGAAAVQENEGVVGTEVAEVERSRAAHGGGGAAFIYAGDAGLGEVAQHVGEIGAAGGLDLDATDDLDRRRALLIEGLFQAGTGDFEFFEFLGFVGFFLIISLLHFLRGKDAGAD